MNRLARKMDGYPAAASVVARKRAVLFNALAYAVDKKYLDTNPLPTLRWQVAEDGRRHRPATGRQSGTGTGTARRSQCPELDRGRIESILWRHVPRGPSPI